MLALDRLHAGSPLCGRAYFITQGEPCGFGVWVNALLNAAGLPPVRRRLPVRPGAGWRPGCWSAATAWPRPWGCAASRR